MADLKHRPAQNLNTILSTLVTANHILDHYGLVDAFGHISVRDPEHAGRFYMTGNVPPAFVCSAEDLAHYNVEDGSPARFGDTRSDTSPYSERFSHSEIMRRYADVNAVIHSHSRDVTAFSISTNSIYMRPMYHMAGFLGAHVPVFDIASCYKHGEAHNMLVNSPRLGEKLADTLSKSSTLRKLGSSYATNPTPQHTVVLQKGHGFTTWGTSIEEAVYRAYYTQENARIQMDATIFSRGMQTALGSQEMADCADMIQASVQKAWAYWSRLVETVPMYRNDLLRLEGKAREADYWSQSEKGQSEKGQSARVDYKQ